MRITISHNRTPQDVIRAVDKSFDTLFEGPPGIPLQITDLKRNWNGPTMTFSLIARAGFLNTPIHGTVLVTDKDLTIDADLGIFEKFLPADKMRTALEGKVRGLLT